MYIRILVILLCLTSLTVVATARFGTVSFVPSIVPPHQRGLFVEFTVLGYSAGFFEVSTQPILDLPGLLI